MLEGMTSPQPTDQAVEEALSGPVVSETLRGSVSPANGHGGHRLNELQREFARQFVLSGGNATKAAALAGYGAPDKAGTRNLVNTSILHEIKRLAIVHTEALLPIAIRQLVNIMCDPSLDARARVAAATALLDRGGMKPKSDGPSVQVNVQVNGQAAQAAIAEVWGARTQRMAGIGGGMSDVSQPDASALLDHQPTAGGHPLPPTGGGIEPPGPVPVPVSIPTTSTEHHAPQPGAPTEGKPSERQHLRRATASVHRAHRAS